MSPVQERPRPRSRRRHQEAFEGVLHALRQTTAFVKTSNLLAIDERKVPVPTTRRADAHRTTTRGAALAAPPPEAHRRGHLLHARRPTERGVARHQWKARALHDVRRVDAQSPSRPEHVAQAEVLCDARQHRLFGQEHALSRTVRCLVLCGILSVSIANDTKRREMDFEKFAWNATQPPVKTHTPVEADKKSTHPDEERQ